METEKKQDKAVVTIPLRDALTDIQNVGIWCSIFMCLASVYCTTNYIATGRQHHRYLAMIFFIVWLPFLTLIFGKDGLTIMIRMYKEIGDGMKIVIAIQILYGLMLAWKFIDSLYFQIMIMAVTLFSFTGYAIYQKNQSNKKK